MRKYIMNMKRDMLRCAEARKYYNDKIALIENRKE